MIRILLCLAIFAFSQSDGRNNEEKLAALLSRLEEKLSNSPALRTSRDDMIETLLEELMEETLALKEKRINTRKKTHQHEKKTYQHACPALSTTENGYFHCEGQKCYLECDQGHAFDGRSTTTCSGGSWAPSPNEMTCSPAFVLVTGGLLNSSTVEVYGTGFHHRLPNMPKPRMGHAVENVDSHIILCGGVPMEFTVYFPVPHALKQCIELTDGFTWKEYPYTHVGRDIHASVHLHGSIYWLGGHMSPDTMESISPEGADNQEWTMEPNFGEETDEDGETYKFKHACAAKISPTEFLVTGGFYDAQLTLKYNVVTGELTKMADMNFCRSGHGCNYIKDEALGIEGVIVGGGYPLCDEEELNSSVSFALTSSSEFYDLKTGEWKNVGDMGTKKRGMRMIFAQGNIYAFGGMSRLGKDPTKDPDTADNVQLNKDGFANIMAFAFEKYVEKYDPATETWSFADEMIFRRNFMGLALISEREFYFGCLAPITPEHGKFICPAPGSSANVEKKCTLRCDQGYAPNGGSISRCSGGSWAPSLSALTCSPFRSESEVGMDALMHAAFSY